MKLVLRFFVIAWLATSKQQYLTDAVAAFKTFASSTAPKDIITVRDSYYMVIGVDALASSFR